MGCCEFCHCEQPRRTRGGILSLLFGAALIYVLLVFGGGTLINTGHPVASEAGRLMQTVTLVEPSIDWAHVNGHPGIAHAIETLARGLPIQHVLS